MTGTSVSWLWDSCKSKMLDTLNTFFGTPLLPSLLWLSLRNAIFGKFLKYAAGIFSMLFPSRKSWVVVGGKPGGMLLSWFLARLICTRLFRPFRLTSVTASSISLFPWRSKRLSLSRPMKTRAGILEMRFRERRRCSRLAGSFDGTADKRLSSM